MSVGTQQTLHVAGPAAKRNHSNGDLRTNTETKETAARVSGGGVVERQPRVFVAADNRLLRESISRMLVKSREVEVAGSDFVGPFRAEDLLKEDADILILSSHRNGNEDLAAIRMANGGSQSSNSPDWRNVRRVRVSAVCAGGSSRVPATRSLCKGRGGRDPGTAIRRSDLPRQAMRNSVPVSRERGEFLPFRDRATKNGVDALIPLIAEGLKNKEIANRFCLSEQTVKNHVYRMKHKIGAEDRLSIVQVCGTQGFMS